MSEAQMKGWYDPGLEVPGASSWVESKHSVRGEQRIIDFISHMLQEGRCYQLRLGTITAPLTTDVLITDTAAEMCYDAGSGLTIIPIQLGVTSEDINTNLGLEFALKGVGAVSTAGTAFTPLPLLQGGAAASGSARVSGAGGVTVAAELATTTVRIWEFSHIATTTVATTANAHTLTVAATTAQLQYVGKGPSCIYFQSGGAAGPTIFAHLNVMELLSTAIG